MTIVARTARIAAGTDHVGSQAILLAAPGEGCGSRRRTAAATAESDTLPPYKRRPGRRRAEPSALRRPVRLGRVQTRQALPLRDDLAGRHPYGAPMLDVPVRLNVNENPYPPSPALVAAVADAVAAVAGTLNRYPDRDAVELREALARYLGHGLTTAQVWAANGSNEIIQQVLQAFGGPGRSALGFEPSYSMHPLIALTTSTRWIAGARDEDFGLDPDRAVAAIREHQPDVVFLTSPNNPTGTALPLMAIEAVYAAAPGMVVVDEAYAEFARDPGGSALSLLPGRERLVVTRTMSKAFALAGARLGYLAGAPAVVDALQIVRLPYHLSAVTQAVALVALRHADELLGSVKILKAERGTTVDWLRRAGLATADSDANFVLFGTFGDRHAVWQAMLDRGVLIREVGPPGWLRVSIGTADEMETFKTALDEVLGQ
jgi:histidinol-phosphate aminotransferase